MGVVRVSYSLCWCAVGTDPIFLRGQAGAGRLSSLVSGRLSHTHSQSHQHCVTPHTCSLVWLLSSVCARACRVSRLWCAASRDPAIAQQPACSCARQRLARCGTASVSSSVALLLLAVPTPVDVIRAHGDRVPLLGGVAVPDAVRPAAGAGLLRLRLGARAWG